ncbi:MAG: hypothetical protein ACKO0N_06000 [Planctomycetota bacterium]
MKTLTVILSIAVAGLLVLVVYQQGSINRVEQELLIQKSNHRSNVSTEHAAIEQPTIDIPELEKRFRKLDNTSNLDDVFTILGLDSYQSFLHNSMRESQGMMAVSRTYKLLDNCQLTTCVFENGRTVCKLSTPTKPDSTEIEIAHLPENHPRLKYWHGIR